MHSLQSIVNLDQHPLSECSFQQQCKKTLDNTGTLVLKGFLHNEVINSIRIDGENMQHLAFYSEKKHNIYLADKDPDYSDEHPRNRLITSSKE